MEGAINFSNMNINEQILILKKNYTLKKLYFQNNLHKSLKEKDFNLLINEIEIPSNYFHKIYVFIKKSDFKNKENVILNFIKNNNIYENILFKIFKNFFEYENIVKYIIENFSIDYQYSLEFIKNNNKYLLNGEEFIKIMKFLKKININFGWLNFFININTIIYLKKEIDNEKYYKYDKILKELKNKKNEENENNLKKELNNNIINNKDIDLNLLNKFKNNENNIIIKEKILI
jgi:hypothetical protein